MGNYQYVIGGSGAETLASIERAQIIGNGSSLAAGTRLSITLPSARQETGLGPPGQGLVHASVDNYLLHLGPLVE